MNGISFRRQLSLCHIHKITDHLEEIEGKANGHEKIRKHSPGKGKIREKTPENIAGIFEYKETEQAQGQKESRQKMKFLRIR